MTTRARIARLIDHTLLKPEATTAQVNALIAEAAALGAYSVCVSPSLLPLNLPDGLHLATVCGFPSGAHACRASGMRRTAGIHSPRRPYRPILKGTDRTATAPSTPTARIMIARAR